MFSFTTITHRTRTSSNHLQESELQVQWLAKHINTGICPKSESRLCKQHQQRSPSTQHLEESSIAYNKPKNQEY
jgi:hypothetical protein